jgi:hypothetical protein
MLADFNIAKFQEYFNEKYANIDVDPTYYCDFIADAEDPNICDIIEDLSEYQDIWGQGLSEPLITLRNVLIGPGTLSLVGQQKGKPTLRIVAQNGVTCVRFNSSVEEFDSLKLPPSDEMVDQYYRADIVGTTQINEFRDTRCPQILIQDYEILGVEYKF